MRAVLQRVSHASVSVDGAVIGRTGPGLLILVCAMRGDGEAEAARLAAKIARLRVFADAAGKMNLSLTETGGGALVVSQFTLAANTDKGMRPSFTRAADPGDLRNNRAGDSHAANSSRMVSRWVQSTGCTS